MENNKLIAEFMGFPKQQDAVDDRTIAYYIGDVIKADNRHNENEDDVFHPDDMQFHKDWDWLMSVVEKIESLGYEFFIVEDRVKIAHNTDHSTETIIDFTLGGSKRDATYKAVVKFINEYNRTDGK